MNDIAAQLAMIETGEAIREQQHRERLRDTFAAAALTGLVASNADLEDTMQGVCEDAYSWADAMLRERERQFDRSQPIEPADATPDTNTTPAEGSVQSEGTLSDAEREAIEQMLDEVSGKARAESWVPDILRHMLERLA
jgi:hypothetical protein